MTLQPEELEALRELAPKFTPPTWHVFAPSWLHMGDCVHCGNTESTCKQIATKYAAARTALPRLLSHIESLERAAYVDRESLAQFMLLHSFATGHGDTIADLLGELDWQLRERLSGIEAERDALKIAATHDAELFIEEAIDRNATIKKLGIFLTQHLDEDAWKTAERMCLGISESFKTARAAALDEAAKVAETAAKRAFLTSRVDGKFQMDWEKAGVELSNVAAAITALKDTQ